MKFLFKLIFSSFFAGVISAQANTLLPAACIEQIDEKVRKILVILDGRFDLNDEHATRAGIDRSEIKELPLARHPNEKRLRYRRFETSGRFQMKEYRIRLNLSSIKYEDCFIHGIDLILLTPFEQSDDGIKDHNDHLYPSKKK